MIAAAARGRKKQKRDVESFLKRQRNIVASPTVICFIGPIASDVPGTIAVFERCSPGILTIVAQF